MTGDLFAKNPSKYWTMYYFVLTTAELYRKLNFQKENINNTGLDDND